MINVEQRQAEGWVLTDEGSEVVEKGSHEFLVFKAVPAEGLPQAEIKVLTRESSDRSASLRLCLQCLVS